MLTDSMWAELSPLLPSQANCRGTTARDTRGFVEAVRWLGRTGVGWRDLPPHLGHWHRAPAGEVVADTAYDSDALRGLIAAAGALAVIPPPAPAERAHFDTCAYSKRHHIKQTVNKLKQPRRPATRYDKLHASFEAFVCARIFTFYFN